MNRHVNAIAGRLSLRKPQRDSLEILDRITEIVPPRKTADIAAAIDIIRGEYLLIPHDAINESMTIKGLAAQFACK